MLYPPELRARVWNQWVTLYVSVIHVSQWSRMEPICIKST
jgi:hypothetical protein